MNQENPIPTFGHEDARAVINLIDVVARRGAILGEELGDVALMRKRYVAFWESMAPKEDNLKKESQ